MIEEILQIIKNELVNASKERAHPFKYFYLATSSEIKPALRTLVLRQVENDFSIVFYTDKRSSKVTELVKNPNVALLFFNHKSLLQIRIEGNAELIEDKLRLEEIWAKMPEHSKRDYTTLNAPGSKTSNAENIDYFTSSANFCAIRVSATQLEYLQLQRANHIRAAFEYKNEKWEGRFLVP